MKVFPHTTQETLISMYRPLKPNEADLMLSSPWWDFIHFKSFNQLVLTAAKSYRNRNRKEVSTGIINQIIFEILLVISHTVI